MLKGKLEKDDNESINRIQACDKTDFKALLKKTSSSSDTSKTHKSAWSSLSIGITDEKIKSLVDGLIQELNEKEKDLLLAAEIGQHLLLANQGLSEELAKIRGQRLSVNGKNVTPRKASGEEAKDQTFIEYLGRLEEENYCLKQELIASSTTPKRDSRKVEALENEIRNLRVEIEHKSEECQHLKMKLRKSSAREKLSDCCSFSSTRNSSESDSSHPDLPMLLERPTEVLEPRAMVDVGIQNDLLAETMATLLHENLEIRRALEARGWEVETLKSQLEEPDNDAPPIIPSLDQEIKQASEAQGDSDSVVRILGDLLLAVAMLPVAMGQDVINQVLLLRK